VAITAEQVKTFWDNDLAPFFVPRQARTARPAENAQFPVPTLTRKLLSVEKDPDLATCIDLYSR